MPAGHSRVADYDSIAERYDRRYVLHQYHGISETMLSFIGPKPLPAILEVAEVFPDGIDRSFTSQLTVLTDEEFARGVRASATPETTFD